MSLIIRAETTQFVTALKTISFLESGITEANCQVIYKGGELHYLSYIPGDDFNGITGFEEGEGYQINALQDIDLTDIVEVSGGGGTGNSGSHFCFDLPGLQMRYYSPTNFLQYRYASDTTWLDLVELPSGSGGGTNGVDGREVLLQNTGTYIQWKYTGQTSWTNLIAISALQGAAGAAGTNGKNIELQSTGTHIQWRNVGDASWTNLIAISLLQGPAGADGADGTSVTILGSYASEAALNAAHPSGNTNGDGYLISGYLWVWQGSSFVNVGLIQGPQGVAGTNGRNIELQANGTYIQWRLVGDTTWVNLIALTSIQGPAGSNGINGSNGSNGLSAYEIAVQNGYNGNVTTWLASLRGADGNNGTNGTAATISIGTVSAGVAGSAPVVSNSGTANAAVFNFTFPRGNDGAPGQDGADGVDGQDGTSVVILGSYDSEAALNAAHPSGNTNGDGYIIGENLWVWQGSAFVNVGVIRGPKGDTGDAGNDGAAATIQVGSIVTLSAGSNASVTNTGTANAAILNFSIPRGADGANGSNGSAATISIGSVTTGSPGSSASVSNSGTSSAAILNFTIPQGLTGAQGPAGSGSGGSLTSYHKNLDSSVTLSAGAITEILRQTIPAGRYSITAQAYFFRSGGVYLPLNLQISVLDGTYNSARAIIAAHDHMYTPADMVETTISKTIGLTTIETFTAETTLVLYAQTPSSYTVGVGGSPFNLFSSTNLNIIRLDAATGGGTTTYLNTFQSYTATCPSGYTGTAVTRTRAAGSFSSTVSQADANAQALAAAQAEAQAALVCVVDTPSGGNNQFSYTLPFNLG